jgi:hypothetical protein
MRKHRYSILITLSILSIAFCWVKFGMDHSDKERLDIKTWVLFTQLHNSIYEAFSKTSDTEIYDALAGSLDGPLLDRVYQEAYKSMLTREEGGPECLIRSVDVKDIIVLESARNQNEEYESLKVKCAWTVFSTIRHFEHWHPRLNKFDAIFDLENKKGSLKLVDDNILKQIRVKTLLPANAG